MLMAAARRSSVAANDIPCKPPKLAVNPFFSNLYFATLAIPAMNRKARADNAIEIHARSRKAVSPNFRSGKQMIGNNAMAVKNANAAENG